MRAPRLAAACLIALAIGPRLLAAQGVRDARFERSNRYEGLVGLPISGANRPALDLISFTGFFEPFTGNVDLQIAFFLPSAQSQVHIVVQELTQDLFYRMESKPQAWVPNTWSTFGPWPTGDVIIPGNVRPTNIGVVVHLDDRPEGRSFIAPAFVQENKLAPSLTNYRVQLRPVRTTLSAVDYTLERVEADRLVSVLKQRVAVERPERRPFRIDLDATKLVEARHLLTVTGYVKNSSTERITRQYEFEHRRLPK
jgi:hypothetical protein